jgi:membrane protease YdiL (CAAX protease family)/SAM-dependent methyltransferase
MSGLEIFAPREPRVRRTWSAGAVGLVFVFVILGAVLGTLPGVFLGLIDPLDPNPDWQGLRYQLMAPFAATAMLVFLWVVIFERRSLDSIGLNARGLFRFGRGYACGLGLLALIVGLIWAVGGYQVEAAGSVNVTALIPVAWLLIGFIIQGSTEEIVFRGWFMSLLASRHGLVLAIALNSAIFGLLHAGNIEWSRELMFGLANIVLVGVFLSLYAAREGSLWGVCGWHAAWNWLLGTGFGLPVSGQDAPVAPFLVDLIDTSDASWWLTGGVFGPEASAITSLVLISGVMTVLFRAKFAGYPTPGDASSFTGSIPENYDTFLGPHIFTDYAADISQRARRLDNCDVLELAAGTGIVSRALRDALPATSSLMVTDLNPPMLDVARAKFKSGEKVEFKAADAMALPFADASYDLIVSQFGVMFFPDKVGAFQQASCVLRPGGTLLFNVWGEMASNSFAQVAHETAGEIFPDNPPGFYPVPFSYCDVGVVTADLEAAGFQEITHETVSLDKQVADWSLLARGLVLGNPLVDEIKQRGGQTSEQVIDRFTEAFRTHFGTEPSSMPLKAIIFRATKSE